MSYKPKKPPKIDRSKPVVKCRQFDAELCRKCRHGKPHNPLTYSDHDCRDVIGCGLKHARAVNSVIVHNGSVDSWCEEVHE